MNSKKYIGMDVHQASICVAVRDEGGKIVMESILETKAATILAFIQGIPGNLWVTFEEGTSAAWLCDLGCCQLKPHETSLGRLTKGNSKSSGRRYPSPNFEGPRSQEPVMSRAQQMSPNAE